MRFQKKKYKKYLVYYSINENNNINNPRIKNNLMI